MGSSWLPQREPGSRRLEMQGLARRFRSPTQRMHLIQIRKFTVHVGRLGCQGLRALEERFRDDREELGRITGPVGVYRRRRLTLQTLEGGVHHRTPAPAQRGVGAPWSAIGHAGVLVDLVRKLVQHDIATIDWIGRPRQHLCPRQDNLPLRPGFARQRPSLHLHQPVTDGPLLTYQERVGVDQYLAQSRVVVRPWVAQQQQAGLGGDRDAHLIGDGLALAADEGLLGDKDMDVALELKLQVSRQEGHRGHALAQDAPPRHRERPIPKPGTTALDPPRLRDQRRNAPQRSRDYGDHRQRGAERGRVHCGKMGPAQVNSTAADELASLGLLSQSGVTRRSDVGRVERDQFM